MVQNPADLRGGEVRGDHQARLLPDHLAVAVLNQLFRDITGLPGLPDDGWVDWPARLLIPDHRGFSLVGNPDDRQLVGPAGWRS